MINGAIVDKKMKESICSNCVYHINGYPEVCNALHSPGVSECSDFEEKAERINSNQMVIDDRFFSAVNASMRRSSNPFLDEYRLNQARRDRVAHDFITKAEVKISNYYRRTGKRPEKILVHYNVDLMIRDHLYSVHYGARQLSQIIDCEVVRSQEVPEDYIGIIDCFD